jgi:hypothetical protein
MDTTMEDPPKFEIRFSTRGDLHATLDAMRAEIDKWDTRLIQRNSEPGQPPSDPAVPD